MCKIKQLDEDEYQAYLAQVFGSEWPDPLDQELLESCRDIEGHQSDGCYRIRPAPAFS